MKRGWRGTTLFLPGLPYKGFQTQSGKQDKGKETGCTLLHGRLHRIEGDSKGSEVDPTSIINAWRFVAMHHSTCYQAS